MLVFFTDKFPIVLTKNINLQVQEQKLGCQIYFFLNYRKDLMQDSLNSGRKFNGRWTHEQHLIFLQGLRIYGKNWKKIQQIIPTRSGTQIRSHAQKFFLKLDQNETTSNQFSECEQQSQTENGKIHNNNEDVRDNSSYFLNKILCHSTGFGVTDFWSALVDCKLQSENKECMTHKQGFEIYAKYIGDQTQNSNNNL